MVFHDLVSYFEIECNCLLIMWRCWLKLRTIFFFFVGVKCAVLEKSASFSRHPQAHFINNRTMEVDFLICRIQYHGLLKKIWSFISDVCYSRCFANWMAWQRRSRGLNLQLIYGESSYIALRFRVPYLGQWIICNLKVQLNSLFFSTFLLEIRLLTIGHQNTVINQEIPI